MDAAEEGGHSDNLTAVMDSMGIYDTDLRARTHDNARSNASAVNETQRLLKILLATLNKAVHQGSLPAQSNHGEASDPAALETKPESRHQNELTLHTNYTEVRLCASIAAQSKGESFLPGTAAANYSGVNGSNAQNKLSMLSI